MQLISCKEKLSLKWTKHCVFSSAGNENIINDDDHANNIVLIVKYTNLFVHLVTPSAKDYKKLSKILRKVFERSVYWNEHKTKSENKNTTNELRCFLEYNFVGINRLFVLVYLNQDSDPKRFKARRYYLPKDIIKNYNVIINGKKFYDHTIDSDLKGYEKLENQQQGKVKIVLLVVC